MLVFSSIIVDGSSSGNVIYNRYVNVVGDTGWDLIGSPLDAVSISTFATSNDGSLATIGSSSTPEDTKTKAEMAELKLAYESALTTAIKSNNALTKAKEAYVVNNDDSTWWNPFSWF